MIIPVSAVSVVFIILMGVAPVAGVINEIDTVDVRKVGAVTLKASSRVLIPVVMVPSGNVRSDGAEVILHGVRGPVPNDPIISHRSNVLEPVHVLIVPVSFTGRPLMPS